MVYLQHSRKIDQSVNILENTKNKFSVILPSRELVSLDLKNILAISPRGPSLHKHSVPKVPIAQEIMWNFFHKWKNLLK